MNALFVMEFIIVTMCMRPIVLFYVVQVYAYVDKQAREYIIVGFSYYVCECRIVPNNPFNVLYHIISVLLAVLIYMHNVW